MAVLLYGLLESNQIYERVTFKNGFILLAKPGWGQMSLVQSTGHNWHILPETSHILSHYYMEWSNVETDSGNGNLQTEELKYKEKG